MAKFDLTNIYTKNIIAENVIFHNLCKWKYVQWKKTCLKDYKTSDRFAVNIFLLAILYLVQFKNAKSIWTSVHP